ncbi:MAG: glycosyl transferase, partial [Sulfurospirillum sp.]
MIYLAVVVTAALLTFFIKKAAIKKAIWDIPNQRSSHTTPVPRGGGLAIVIAFYAGLLFLPDVEKHLLYALLCALPIALTGFLDDLLDLSSRTRLAVQFVSAAAALYFLQLPFVPALFGLFLIVWFTNLFNFLDGIDGYVTTEAIFIGIAGYLFTGDGVLLLLSAAAAGFLPFNWQKASIFMGDVGSTFIGFVVAVLLLYHTRTFHEGLIWLLLTAPFWFDATYTLLRRLINGEKITQAHRKHLFQRAVIGGLSHRSVTLILLGIDLLIASLLLLFPE